MSNSSLAAQAVANGPLTAAQPSFNGHGWLVIINLAIMTAAALIMLGLVVKLANDLLTEKGSRGPLVTLVRWLMLAAFSGMMLRTGVEAVALWGWNPLDPERTGWYNTLKRLVDPFGGAAYIITACMFVMTEDVLVRALEKRPFPKRLIADFPKLMRPAMLAVSTLIAAILVVTFR